MKRWYGKLLGFVAGWLLMRHPLGGLVGLIIGHAFDEDWFKLSRENPYRVFGLTSDASDAEIDQALKRVADMRQYLISEPPNAWPHSFAGFGEMAVRFVFSRKLNAIIALHVHYGKGWQKATLEQVADVQDSLTNANVEAIADPYGSGFGLIAADHLPAWA